MMRHGDGVTGDLGTCIQEANNAVRYGRGNDPSIGITAKVIGLERITNPQNEKFDIAFVLHGGYTWYLLLPVINREPSTNGLKKGDYITMYVVDPEVPLSIGGWALSEVTDQYGNAVYRSPALQEPY